MKKVLLAFDGTHFSEGAFRFACSLNRLQPLLLTGVFVPQASYANLWSMAGATDLPNNLPLLEEPDGREVDENITRFAFLCKKYGINCKVHKDFSDFALPELERESRFADLLLIGSESFYQFITGETVNDYLEAALHASECPVLVVPEEFHFPQRIVLAYDGSKSSVFAIRQFAYLFPELAGRETLLAFLKSRDDKDLPEEDNILELAGMHFPKLTVLKLDKHPGREFSEWLQENSQVLLVCGSYGRSLLSQLVRDSFVKDVIEKHQLPVFVAHR
ncbi:universal stress protein [Paraflavisolibacter sp. H34]|uniref:universal stress protein n=1 Tax=Huijunlia imazamoxiresistens TaxID=3127457 RepID=UPI003015BD8A